MANAPPIRIGVMGCANVARRSVVPAILASDDFRLAGVASRSEEKGRAHAEQWHCPFVGDYSSLLQRDDVDAIYVPLPTGLHREWVSRALDAGKHLLVEKSLAASLADAEALVASSGRNRRVMMENYMFQFHAQQQVVLDLVHSRLGELRGFRAAFTFPPLQPGNFRYDKALGGGALLDAGGYPVKACQLFLPGEIRVESACLNYNDDGVDLWGGAMLSSRSPVGTIPLQISFGFDNFYQCGIEFVGQKGRLTTFRTFTAGEGVVPCALLEMPGEKQEFNLPTDNHFLSILEEFSRRIREDDGAKCHAENIRQARLQEQIRQLADKPKEFADAQHR